jgi:hypothetical protein
MYRDMGADPWFFEVDETSGTELWQRLERVVRRPEEAQAQVKRIMAGVEARQKAMLEQVRRAASGPRR